VDVREQLILATLEVYAQAGSRGATTRRIAEAAHLNEVTLFRHFGSKDTLIREALSWLAERALAVRLPRPPRDPAGELTAFCMAQHRGMHETRALLRKMMAEFEEHPEAACVARDITAGIERQLQEYLDELKHAGLAPATWSTTVATSMLMGTLFADAVGRDCMPERYPLSGEEAVPQYVELFLRAIGTTPSTGPRPEPGADLAPLPSQE
jgi:AcrR family transcriptional regulator